MKNLHDILAEPNTIFVWTSADGRETPFEQLQVNHMSNILRRFGPEYLKGNVHGTRKLMFEGVIREWQRRFGHLHRFPQ